MKAVQPDLQMISPHYIVYLDILGYREYLKNSDNNEYALFSSIYKEFSKLNQIGKDPELSVDGIKVKTFSDNIIIAGKISANENEIGVWKFLSYLACIIQLIFCENHDLLTRGCISYGNIFIDDNMVFGEGLVDAVRIEEKASKYPRILVDESIVKRLGNNAIDLKHIKRDNDGKNYLDFLQMIGFPNKGNSGKPSLQKIKINLENRIKKYCKYAYNIEDQSKIIAREKVISKHLWIIEKFNEYCRHIGSDEYKVKYKVVLNKRIMKYELQA